MVEAGKVARVVEADGAARGLSVGHRDGIGELPGCLNDTNVRRLTYRRFEASSAPLETSETIVADRNRSQKSGHVRGAPDPSHGASRGEGRRSDAPAADPHTIENWWSDDRDSLRILASFGVDVADVLQNTRPSDDVDEQGRLIVGRRTVVQAFGTSVLTKTGEPRSARIKDCGHLRPAMRGKEYGLAHWRCKDRLCPSCAPRRATEHATAMLSFVESRATEGTRVLFVTLTQRKQHVSDENADSAIGRFMESWRRLTSKRSRCGRDFALVFAGGMRGVELTWSPKGKKHRDGHVVRFSGWHAHGHCLIEVRPGYTLRQAKLALQRLWKIASAGSDTSALDVQQVAPVADAKADETRRRVFEVCKYPLKLPGFSSPKVLVSAANALAARRSIDGVGDWRGALGKGRLLRDADKPKPPPVRMADQRAGALGRDGLLSFAEFQGGERRHFYASAKAHRAQVIADPRSFDQRDRDVAAGVEYSPPSDLERKQREWSLTTRGGPG